MKYPTLQRHAAAFVFGVLLCVALLTGQAVHFVPVFFPSPYVLAPHEHVCVPGPVCVHT